MIKKRESRTLFKVEGDTKDMVFDQQALRATRIVTPEPSLTTRIREKTRTDKQAEQLKKSENAQEQNKLLLYHGLVYVPAKLRNEVMQQGHDAPTSGHFGVDKTMERITRDYYWPGMWTDIRNYIRQCDICQRSKADRHQQYGLLQPIPQMLRPWESVAMDFITKLPKSKEPRTGNTYDSILTVTDRLT
ncbi:to reverse transcriptase, partial [Aspergillus sclerotialis]